MDWLGQQDRQDRQDKQNKQGQDEQGQDEYRRTGAYLVQEQWLVNSVCLYMNRN